MKMYQNECCLLYIKTVQAVEIPIENKEQFFFKSQ